jgi:hypothetical protein
VRTILVNHNTGGFRKLISLDFHAYVECPNWRLYASCASI